MAGASIVWFRSCFNGCRDHTQISRLGTRVWNLTDRPVELQIRVGSILKKGHTLKPGSSKRLKCKNIYKTYMPNRNSNMEGGECMKNLLYYYDETCHPYVWIHDCVGNSSRMVKQQYISLDDLREFSEIKIFRDHQRGCISVLKKPRTDFC
ncbi:Ring zinc finger protein [Thalictrum thalictroides]|uniref:Ring zinc finger protein n=1 Tax=Thalictrum thalictroides TaxID=46969 RepID=A0A7J6W3J8_THATH|nr:Ring zinc finger protein [Thalictrum thalictroides]